LVQATLGSHAAGDLRSDRRARQLTETRAPSGADQPVDRFHRCGIREDALVERGALDPEMVAQRAFEDGARTVDAAGIVSYTTSGATALRAARERPHVPILVLTSNLNTARRLALLWGAHCVHTTDVSSFANMVEKATRTALREGIAKANQSIVITAGVPFGTPGATNTLRIAWVHD
jgi:pyruvate kinase